MYTCTKSCFTNIIFDVIIMCANDSTGLHGDAVILTGADPILYLPCGV